ncbi:hypothetical protein HK098_001206, partial [Nowakowskiella sp. JEL0407]
STQFERSLRIVAKHKGYHFASHGLFDRKTGELVGGLEKEEDLFRILGVPWLDPELRNA